MTDQSGAVREKIAAIDLWPHLKTILNALGGSRQRRALYGLGVAVVVIVAATAYGQIRLNAWNEPFYDALSRKDLPGVTKQLLVFAYIAGALLVLNVAQTWLSQMTKLKLREGLTRDLFFQWLKPHRGFHIANLGEIGVNPDQRIDADAQHLAEVSTDLGIGLLQATLLLVSFVGVLWGLSEGVSFDIFGKNIAIPGYMVWAALLYASVASFGSWRVGRPLVELGAERYARESEMRFALMNANEHIEAISVYRGEKLEENRLHDELDRLLAVLRRIVTATTNLTWVTAGYGWFTIVAPIIVAAPAYFAGNLTFGGLLMAVGAFTQVQQSLRWFVDNAGVIADWRATLHRVADFREALFDIDRREKTRAIAFEETSGDRLILNNLSVYSPAGVTTLSEAHVEIAPGDHVLIVGEPRSGKTRFFEAIAGLWTAGNGAVRLPRAENIFFAPKRPYIADLTLRDILAYPSPPQSFPQDAYDAALARFALDHLTPLLDGAAPWEKELTDVEQQELAFARLLLHKPRFVVVDEAIDSLSPHARETLFDVFGKELAETALVYISGPKAPDKFFQRVLRLTLNAPPPDAAAS
ncbi:ABC transporter ATP-binding protein/permease [Methylocystis sp. 9N]|uniref:ABC transporter ATP-binding protein/permease n=1 Tax=Methylocystis borbori TaxID=3118750 RepID=A0ABU7XFK9_9HYPH